MSASTATCPFYLKGTCRRGKSCELRHGKPRSAKSPSTPVCKYFLQKKCVYGDKCKQSHAKSHAKKPPPASKSGASSGTESIKPDPDPPSAQETPDEQDQSGWGSAPTGWGQDAPDDAGGTPPQEGEATTKPACFFFAQGMCGKGDGCEFAHTASSTDGSGKDSDAKPPSPSKKKSEPKICKHYVRGSCRAGDACRLKHILPVDKSSNAAAGSESSESHSDWDANGPSNGTAGISASGGPEAADQHIPFSNGTADAEDEMHWSADPAFDDADDIYGDRDDQEVNEDEDDASKNVEDANQEGEHEDEDEDEDNGEADTTFTQHEQAASSGYASSRSTKEPSRRGSWYGSGWDEPPLSSASAPSSVGHPPRRTPERQHLSPLVPQPAPPVTTSHAPAVQPHWSQFADPQADPKIAFCKPHAQALCAQGAACRFRHFLTPEEYTLLFHDPQPNLWTYTSNVGVAPPPLQPVGLVYNIPAVTISQPDITENETSAPPTKPISTFKQECKFYRLGTCRNAELCPYEHTQHPDPVVPTPTSARANREWGRPSSRNRDGKIDAPCRFFVEKNYCNRGNDCKFRHDKSTDRVDDAAPAWPSDDNNNNNDDAQKEADNGWGDDGSNNNSGWNNDSNDNSGWNNDNGGGGWGATATNADSWGTSWDDAGNMGDSSGQTTSTPQTTRRTNECYQFKEGRCRRGNDCRFSHDLQPNKNSGGDEWPPEEPSAPAPASCVAQSVPCRFFARGNCRRGNDCPDRHDPPEKESTQEKPQENGWPSESDARTVEDGTADENQAQPADDPPPQEEPHWTASWEIENSPAQIAPGSINKPCKMFAQGFCRFGDECSFKHGIDSDAGPTGPAGTMEANSSEQPVSSDYDDDDDQRSSASDYMAASPPIARDAESEPEGQPQPTISDHPVVVVSRYWDQCNISYGEDMTPTTVTTLADSKKLILSNLPVDVAPEDIARLTRPYGEIAEIISLDETVHSAVIQVEFEEASQAYEAFKNLDGQEYESNVISASLKGTRTVPIKRSVGQKIYIKVSWPKPSKRAWSHYPTINKAKQQAVDLNGVIIRGRAIKASFVSPSKIQKTAFAVFLQNIDPETTKSELDAICTQSDLITIDPPIYSEDATDEIKSTFDELGPTEQFDVLPVTSGATSTAFVTFNNEAVAAEVVSKLKSRPLPFLGKESLTIRDIHYARYCIAKAQFEVIKSEIDNLKEQSDGSNKCTIQYDDHRSGKLVWIRIHAPFDNSTQFADTNGELQSIVQGIVVMSDGKEVWDEYFETSSSANAMGRAQTLTDTLIQCDLRAKCIRIFGSKVNQAQAQAQIMKGFSKVHALRKEIDLPRHKLHPLVNGEFKTLQDTIGAHKILLDVFRSKLVMLGSPDEVSKANNVISQMNDSAPTASSSRNTCQICHHSAVNPVLLSCHHVYCNNCLRFAIRQTRIAPFQCISQHTSRDGENRQCSARVPYAILHDILLAEEDQVLRATWYACVRSRPHELFFCPSLDCSAVHRVRNEGVNIKCALCVSELCTYCKSLAHIGRPCATRA